MSAASPKHQSQAVGRMRSAATDAPLFGCRQSHWPRRAVAVLACGILCSTAGSPATEPADTAGRASVRFGFTRSMFREVNENDARAALKAYAGVIAQNRGFNALANPVIFEGPAEMATALQEEKVDIIAALSAEILALPGELLTGPYLITMRGQVVGEEYLLLARSDRGFSTPVDLKGRRVAVLNNVRGSLAECWLEVLLGTRGPDALGNFLGELKFVTKPSLAVLPVFFGQMDACVITRESFAIVTEMNPQVGRQLRILAVSPVVVPAITCFRRNIDPMVRAEVLNTLDTLHANVSGQQVLTIFQSERVEAHDDSALESTRRLLADCARLEAPPAAPPPVAANAAKSVPYR